MNKKLTFLLLTNLLLSLTYAQITYTFNGNGSWSVVSNWVNNTLPPNPLPNGSTIFISPLTGGVCILDFAQTISQGANLVITNNSSLQISGGVIVNNNQSTYQSVTICNQEWMDKNLDVSTYRNGDTIPQVSNSGQWYNLKTGAWCYADNNANNSGVYGKLYNWYAVNDSRGLAPKGWHIPSDSEWLILSNCLGGYSIAGNLLKEIGTVHWTSPNTGATNQSRFTGLPGGLRGAGGVFSSPGQVGYFWSSTDNNSFYARLRYLLNTSSTLSSNGYGKYYGFSVRCIRDSFMSNPTMPNITTNEVSAIASNSIISGGNITNDGGRDVTVRGVVWSTSPNPTISLSTKTVDGSGIAIYVSSIQGLIPNTTYYIRAYASNSIGTNYGNELTFTTLSNVIDTVKICNQVWMKNNLIVSTYRNGDTIPQVTDPNLWKTLTTGAWCYYNNDSTNYEATFYGKIYNWYAVNDPRGIAPTGWHIPTDNEWSTLSTCLGGDNIAGGKMKEVGFLYWDSPNEGATNESGFTGLPSGSRNTLGEFFNFYLFTYYSSSTENTTTAIWARKLDYSTSILSRLSINKISGISVRCIKD